MRIFANGLNNVIMSKRFLYLAVAIMTMFIASCEKDTPVVDDENVDDELIVVIEVGGIEGVPTIIEVADKDIATVKIVAHTLRQNSQGQLYGVHNVVASAKIKNGSIKLNFPVTIPEKYLGITFPLYNIMHFDEGITVSDIQAQTGDVFIRAYNSAGQFIGSFNLEDSNWIPWILYSDRSFTVRGRFSNGFEIDYRFNKGVNVTYRSIWDGNLISTTQRPLGVNLEWVFRPRPVSPPF